MVELIGREKEIEQIQHFLSYESENSKLISIHGPGGIGKTALLRALRERFTSQPAIITTDLIDLVEERLSQIRFLRSEIAAQLDPNQAVFEKYYHRVNEFDRQLAHTTNVQDISEAQVQIEASFVSAYKTIVSAGQTIIIFLDTMEAIDAHPKEWEELILPFFSKLPLTHFIVGGRDAYKWRPLLNRQFSTFHELSIPISGFSLNETKLYFNLSPTGQDTAPDLQEKIHLLTNGRPILIDLAIEWSRRKLPFESLSLVNIDALRQGIQTFQQQTTEASIPLDSGVTVTFPDLAKEFERELIENILELPVRYELPILTMVYLQQFGMELPLLREITNTFLTSVDDDNVLFEELKDFVFIKIIPTNRLILHDEAKRMIEEYQLWERYDGTKEIRIDLFTLLHKYFEHNSNSYELMLDQAEINSYADIEHINQRITKLRCQQLRFAFEINLDSGFEEFKDLFEKSTKLRLFLLSEGLLDVAVTFSKTKEQQFQLQLERINYYFDIAAYQQAENVIREMLEDPDVPPSVQVDLFFHLGNIDINSGRGVNLARRHYQTALNLCKENNLQKSQPKLLNELGYLHRLQGNLKDAVNYYDQALRLAIEIGNTVEEISALINWSFVDSRLGEYEPGYQKLQKVFEYLESQDIPDRELVGRYYSVLGEVARYHGKYEEAIEAYNNALQQFTSSEDEAWPGLIISQRGVAYLNQFIADPDQLNFADQARDDLSIAVRMCRRANKNVLPMALHRLGRYYQAIEDFGTAIRTFREGYQISKLQEDWQFVVENLTNLSEVLFYKWEYTKDSSLTEEMEHNLAEIDKLRQEGFNYPHLYGKMQQLLANVLILEKRYNDALELYTKSILNMTEQEKFVGRDRLDNRLREMEHLISKMPFDWQTTWWQEIYKTAKESSFATEPEVMTYLTDKYNSTQKSKGNTIRV